MTIEEAILRSFGWNPDPEKLRRYREKCEEYRNREDPFTEAHYVSREFARSRNSLKHYRQWQQAKRASR